MPLIVMLILSTLAVGMQPVQAQGTGTLALSPETIYVEKDNETVTLPNWPNFDVNVTITNVTNIVGAVFSVHWDPTILNFTSVYGCPPFQIPGYPDYLLPTGAGGISGLMYTVNYTEGNLKQAAQVQLAPFSKKNYTAPNWGWVAKLTFEFIGTPPSPGSSINTNITIVDNPGAGMATEWTPDGVIWNDFQTLGKCEFTYVTPPPPPAMLTIRPNALGTFTEWTAYPAAPNWQCVDDETRNNDTDYVYVTATGKADSYNLQNTALTGNISNVTVNIYAKQTTGNEKVKLMLVINGTEYYGNQYNPGTEYALYTSVWANNPATDLNWTWSDINSLEAGIESLKAGPFGGEIRVTQLYVEILYIPTIAGFDLNLRVMDWDLSDSIPGAYVYKNSDVKISDVNGWANWTGVNGTVQIKVKWYGFWVNGTSVTVDSDKTIDLQCNIFDIEVTCIEGLQGAFLQYVNVTVYNATSVAGNMIRTGITGSDGKVTLANVPNATLTFTCYDGASPQNVIANVTRTITAENQTETITCDQNYISTTHTWGIIGIYSSALSLGLILLLGFAAGKPSRMLNCLKERIKKVRSKQKKGKEVGKTHESFNA